MLVVLPLSHFIIPPTTERMLLLIRLFPRIHDRSPYRRFLNEPKSKSIDECINENDLDRDASLMNHFAGQAGLSISA